MHSPRSTNIQEKQPKIPSDKSSIIGSLCKTLLLSGLFLYLISIILLNHPNCPSTEFLSPFKLTIPSSKQNLSAPSATNINHLMFGLLGSVGTWKHRKAYIESWWRPNVTHGYLYLDSAPTDDLLPWPSSSPPFRVSEDNTSSVRVWKHREAYIESWWRPNITYGYLYHDTAPTDDILPWPSSSPPFRVSENNTRLIEEGKLHMAPLMVRMVHGIMEVMREKREGLRWLVMGDDDSIFFVDNFVDVLSTYDHTKYIYIGGHSEFIPSNVHFSFHTGFGGAGFVLSYPLAEALVMSIEECLKRYPYLGSADQITMTCIADVGVDLTSNKGIHQIDLRGDISGFLFGHPQSPLLSLHHFDVVDPIFPFLNRSESANQLLKAASLGQSRMMQQTICYEKQRNWSFAISWGYSAHIYENIIPRSILKKPLETFGPWYRAKPPFYLFDTRWRSSDPCEAPHIFFFQSIEKSPKDEIITTYIRASPRGISTCLSSGNHSADYISTIRVFSPATKLIKVGRSECCDILPADGTNMAEVKYRSCMNNEIIA